MFRRILTAAVVALTLAGATLSTTQSARAGSLGKVIAAGIIGTAVGAIAAGSSARARQDQGSLCDDRADDRSGG